MAKLLLLDEDKMHDDFFQDTAMVGIAANLPAYHFCWLLNNHFDIAFERDLRQDVKLEKEEKEQKQTNVLSIFDTPPAAPQGKTELVQKKTEKYNFPVYHYNLPNSNDQYILYKLKDKGEGLLPELKHLDFLWMIKTTLFEKDARRIADELKKLPSVRLSQILNADQMKNLNMLFV